MQELKWLDGIKRRWAPKTPNQALKTDKVYILSCLIEVTPKVLEHAFSSYESIVIQLNANHDKHDSAHQDKYIWF